MQNNERMDNWNKKSWLDEFVSNPRLSKDLTTIYADDVLQAVSDNSFGTLDEAIASLKEEAGLTTAEVNDIKRIVVAKTEPEVFVAEQNILKAKKSDLMELIRLATEVCEKCDKAPCECSHKLSTPIAKAINRIGLITLAEICDKAELDTPAEEEKKDIERLEEKTNEPAIELTAEATRVKEAIASGASVAEAMEKSSSGMNPGFQAYLDKKKKEGEGGKKSEDEEVDKEEKSEKSASLVAKAEKWADFLTTKGYFQGADQPSVEGDITSNDPEKLGYPKDVKYDRKPMAVPVGEDARPYEQKAFEGAADETKKVMGPKGEELKLKELWQRAKYMGYIKKLVKQASTPPSISEDLMHKLKSEYSGDLEKAYATAWKIHNEGNGDKK